MSSNVKETVIQFGEGRISARICGLFLPQASREGLYDGKIVVVQPIEKGMCQVLADQNCEYNLFLRGIDNGQVVNEHTHVKSGISRYSPQSEYIALAESPDLRVSSFKILNTGAAVSEFCGSPFPRAPPFPPGKAIPSFSARYHAGCKGSRPSGSGLMDDIPDICKVVIAIAVPG